LRPPAAGMGRPKGSVNKTTAAAKEALSLAFEGIGGVQRLTAWAEEQPTEFYKLWIKLLPAEVKADLTGDMNFTVVVKRFTDA
jgi:hypothetical protein